MFSRSALVIAVISLFSLESHAFAAEQTSTSSAQGSEKKFSEAQVRLLRFDFAASELSKYYAPKYDPDKDDADWYVATAWLTQRCYQDMCEQVTALPAEEVRDVISRSELVPSNFWGKTLGSYGAEFAKGEYLRYLKLKLHTAQKEFETVCVFAHTSVDTYQPPKHMLSFFEGFRQMAALKAKDTQGR